MSGPVLESVLTCPHCGHRKAERMPTDACQFFYECEHCSARLRLRPGDCCVFCSYGSVKCPPVQLQRSCCSDVEEIAKELLALFPQLDDVGRAIVLALYRQLAEGAPVPLGALAARLQISSDAVSEQMTAWPGVYYDEHRRVIGFQGLTIAPMAHRLRVEGRELYAWCAWDTLFLPELVGATIHVESTCRATGHAIYLTVTPQALESASPPEAVISFLIPQSAEIKKDVITSFCHYVHFFSSAQAARSWLAQRPDAFLLGVTDAYKLGRRINEARYGDRLRDLRARAS